MEQHDQRLNFTVHPTHEKNGPYLNIVVVVEALVREEFDEDRCSVGLTGGVAEVGSEVEQHIRESAGSDVQTGASAADSILRALIIKRRNVIRSIIKVGKHAPPRALIQISFI